jgi:hypothetical protein
MKRTREYTIAHQKKKKNTQHQQGSIITIVTSNVTLPFVLCCIISSFIVYPNNSIFWDDTQKARSNSLVAIKNSKWTPKLNIRYDIWRIASFRPYTQSGLAGLVASENKPIPVSPVHFLNRRGYAKESDGGKLQTPRQILSCYE